MADRGTQERVPSSNFDWSVAEGDWTHTPVAWGENTTEICGDSGPSGDRVWLDGEWRSV